jgi:hypothetical protein
MKKQLHFLSGLPRSGITLLAAILNQNPLFHTISKSGLVEALTAIANSWAQTPILDTNDTDRRKLADTMRNVIDSFYADIDKPIVIDAAKGWILPHIISAMTSVLQRRLKFIATVRSVPDCAASFVRAANLSDIDDFIYTGKPLEHLKAAYVTLSDSYMATPDIFLLVEYEDLISNPKQEMERIHAFLELPPFEYDFNNVDCSVVEADDYDLPVSTKLGKIHAIARQHNESPVQVLKHHYASFIQPEFWLKTPRTIPIIHDLDLQFEASKRGDFHEGWRLCQKLETETPQDNRAAFNRGWYLLRQGKIQQGFAAMDRGRIAGVFGNKKPATQMLPWDGKSKGVVLLYLEGGLGDQFHQIRYAKYIVARGCKVVVACTGELVSIFSQIEGVSAVVQHEAVFGIYHDYWVAGMSSVVPLGFELADISGKPYIDKPIVIKGNKKRIGLRWQGNPMFEHEHHKKFPSGLLFSAVYGFDVEFISLQRDEGSQACPYWVSEVPLNNWADTRAAIATCDLVITSCTSVSHLAGAMGVETWVITPVMPYFLYAIEGDKTPYYDCFTLFRQEVYGDWRAPFEKVNEALKLKYKGK